MDKRDYGNRGVVWMDGRRRVATIRRTTGAGLGWMVHWQDREPYVNEGPIATGARNACKWFRKKGDAVESVEQILRLEN